MTLLDKLKQTFINWLSHEMPSQEVPMCDFERIKYELRPCDVILIEGRSRISQVIKNITQSSWSHAALYVGRLHDIENPLLRQRVQEHYDGEYEDQLIIESLLGMGTVVHPLQRYEEHHVRICRPKGISRIDAQHVIGFAIGRLGMEYGIRHNLDLARFLLPFSILPRRWGSSLFEHHVGVPTKEICSSMIAEAFSSVRFPILPIIKAGEGDEVEFYHRNPKLYTPRDFDYSPYFEIIKYPLYEVSEHAAYRHLPWTEIDKPINDLSDIPIKKKQPPTTESRTFFGKTF